MFSLPYKSMLRLTARLDRMTKKSHEFVQISRPSTYLDVCLESKRIGRVVTWLSRIHLKSEQDRLVSSHGSLNRCPLENDMAVIVVVASKCLQDCQRIICARDPETCLPCGTAEAEVSRSSKYRKGRSRREALLGQLRAC
jgi:hypothetical protein